MCISGLVVVFAAAVVDAAVVVVTVVAAVDAAVVAAINHDNNDDRIQGYLGISLETKRVGNWMLGFCIFCVAEGEEGGGPREGGREGGRG